MPGRLCGGGETGRGGWGGHYYATRGAECLCVRVCVCARECVGPVVQDLADVPTVVLGADVHPLHPAEDMGEVLACLADCVGERE